MQAQDLTTIGFATALVQGNSLSVTNAFGLFISIFGIALYNRLKYKEQIGLKALAYQRVGSEERGEHGGTSDDDDDRGGDTDGPEQIEMQIIDARTPGTYT